MAKNKKIYSFDEKASAEEILKNGFPSGIINPYAMYILAKYYREEYGFGAVRLEKALIAFAKAQDENFNPVIEASNIKKWVKAGLEHKLRKKDTIIVTHAEMDVIKSVQDLKQRKILFASLVLCKYIKASSSGTSEKYFLNYSAFLKIADMLDFKITEAGIALVFSNFAKLGYIVPYSAEKECVRINIVNNDSPMAVSISEPERAMEYYKVYFGGEVAYCEKCYTEIVKSNNRQRLCKSCAEEVKREKTRERVRKYRNALETSIINEI